jgi:nucleobase:cation symporter-1, NCS1 family
MRTTTTQQRAGGLEVRSIDYVPLSERRGKVWHLGPLWFMSNAQIATLAVGLISIIEGASAIQAPAGAWAPRARQSYCRAL